MKLLIGLLFLLGLLAADSRPVLCLDPSLLEHAEQLRRQNQVLDKKSFSQMLGEATRYFSSFSFQEYRAFRRKQVKRSQLYVHALSDFFANFREYVDLSGYRPGMIFPTPGSNSNFDYVYALALTTHYISPVGQLPLALRDGFRPISLHDLMVRGLESRKHSIAVYKLVQENKDLVLFYLQARFNASVYFSLYPVFNSQQSFLHMVSRWDYDFKNLKSEQSLTQLGFLLESAIEVRDILARYKISSTPVFVSRFGFSKTSLSEILQSMNVPEIESRSSEKRIIYAQRLSDLLRRLKKPYL